MKPLTQLVEGVRQNTSCGHIPPHWAKSSFYGAGYKAACDRLIPALKEALDLLETFIGCRIDRGAEFTWSDHEIVDAFVLADAVQVKIRALLTQTSGEAKQ